VCGSYVDIPGMRLVALGGEQTSCVVGREPLDAEAVSFCRRLAYLLAEDCGLKIEDVYGRV
jgi:hypothetical protein